MAKFRDLANANVSGEGRAEELGALIDALLPVLVDRLAETGLGEIEVERNGATVRVRSESLGVQQAASFGAPAQGAAGQAAAAAPAPSSVSAARKRAVRGAVGAPRGRQRHNDGVAENVNRHAPAHVGAAP